MSAVRTVLVCEAQVPFVYGGAERHVRALVAELRRQGYRAKKVSIPFKPYPKGELLTQVALWRLVDLSEANYEPVDLVIATKFPTYFVRHPNKVTWLFHQYRGIYELCGTAFSEFSHAEGDVRLRDRLITLDTEALAESKRLFSNARNPATRLAKYNGLSHLVRSSNQFTAQPLDPVYTPLTRGAHASSWVRFENDQPVLVALRTQRSDGGPGNADAFHLRRRAHGLCHRQGYRSRHS